MSTSYPLDQALVDAAIMIGRRGWPQRFPVDGYVAIRVPDAPYEMYAVLALDATTHGVNVAYGPRARELLLQAEDAPEDDLADDALDLLGFAMAPAEALPPEARELLRRAGHDDRGGGSRPWFMCKRAGRRGRPLNRDERRTLLYVLQGLLRADDEGRLRPAAVRPGAKLQRLVVSGDPLRPDVAYETATIDPAATAPSAARALDPAHDVDLTGLPRLRRRYGVRFERTPTEIGDEGRTVYFLFVMDMDEERLIHARMVPGGDLEEVAQSLCRVFEGDNDAGVRGVPRELWCTSDLLRRALASPFARADVRCVLKRNLPALDRAFGEFVALLAADLAERAGTDPDGVPAPDDLAGWKAADRVVCETIGEDVIGRGWLNRTNVKAFLGDGLLTEAFVEAPDANIALTMAFCEWCFAERRTPKHPHSLLEQALAAGPSDAARALLTARRDAKFGLYVVESVQPGASVDLRDVALGGRLKVHDIAMSQSAQPGLIIAARAHVAGNFNFLTLFSPGFAQLDHDAAIEALRDAGAGTGLEKLAAKPHLVGRLWALARDLAATPRPRPRLANMDGDPLVDHDALYELDDPAAVRSAFLARKDFDHDPAQDEYRWIRQEEPGKKPIKNTIVARLRLIGSQLLVATNSARRHEAAHAWIARLPGVRFVSVKAEQFDMNRKVPLDDRLPDPANEAPQLAPESIAALQATVDAHAATWPDIPLPVLGGKTPRQAMKTAAGRAKVRVLINATPDPYAPPGASIKYPRERVLRDLGLSSEA
jgi:hypothetical protein